MTTLQPKFYATPRKLIERADLADRFFDYLQAQSAELTARVYDSPGVFSPRLGLSSSGNDEFDIDGASLATDGLGYILEASESPDCQSVAFQNTAAVSYEVSIKRSEGVTQSTQANPSTGVPEYVAKSDYIGESGAPDSVALIGNDIELVIDSLCEAGVTHAGRKALVYLNLPASPLSLVAVQELTVAWSGGQNKITVVADKLGQSIASTTASDYTVIVLGPTVRRNSSKANTPGYVVIGRVLGNGPAATPTALSTTSQPEIAVSLSNVNEAFASFAALRSVTIGGAGKKASLAAATWGAASAVWLDQIFHFGGFTSSSDETSPTAATRSYDTATDVWNNALAAMPDAYNGMPAAVTVDDLIYVFGGHDGAVTSSALARTYNPASNTWGTVTAMPAARHGGALVAIGTDVYYLGGQPAPGFAGSVSCYKYNTLTDSWAGIADMPTGKSRHAAAVVDGKIYVLGGSATEGSGFGTVDATCYAYDPTSNSWETLASHPTEAYRGVVKYGGLYMPAVAVHNGVIHFVSGGGATQTAAGLHRAYSTKLDEWSELPSPKAPYTFGTTYGIVDGILYMWGGRVRSNPPPESAAVVAYGFAISLEAVAIAQSNGSVSDVGTIGTTSTGSSQLEDMSIARTRFAACRVGGAILLCGGLDSAGAELDSAELYWPETQIRFPLDDMATARIDHGAISVGDDRVMVFGGRLDVLPAVINAQVYRYDLHTNAWETLASGPTRSGYGIASDGSLVYIIGGFNDAGASQDEVYAWDLTKGQMVSPEIGDLDLALEPGAAAATVFGDDVILAGPDNSIRSMKRGPTGAVSATLNPMSAGSLASLTSVAFHVAMTQWDGALYIYNPGEQTIQRFDVKSQRLSTVATGVVKRHDAQIIAAYGRLLILGGSASVGGILGINDVYAIELAASQLERSHEPTNFSTGKRAATVGFKPGQVYGSVVHDPFTTAEHVRLTAESSFS